MNAFVSCSTVGIPGVNHRFAAKLSAHGVRTRLELANLCDDDDRCLDIALRSYAISRERFETGDITSQTLADNRDRLVSARQSYLDAYVSFRLAGADLRRQTGVQIDHLGLSA